MRFKGILVTFFFILVLTGCGAKEHSIVFGESLNIDETLSIESTPVTELELLSNPIDLVTTSYYEVTFNSEFLLEAEELEKNPFSFYVMYKGEQYEGVAIKELLHSFTMTNEEYENLKILNELFERKEDLIFNQDNLTLKGTLYFKDINEIDELSFHIKNKKHDIKIESTKEGIKKRKVTEFMKDGKMPNFVSDLFIIEFLDFFKVEELDIREYGGEYDGSTLNIPSLTGVAYIEVKITPLQDEVVLPFMQVHLIDYDAYGIMELEPRSYINGYKNILNGKVITEEVKGLIPFDFIMQNDFEFNKDTTFELLIDLSDNHSLDPSVNFRFNGYGK